MKIGIYYHEKTVPSAAVSALGEALRTRGAQVEAFTCEEDIRGVDRLIVLGGDGAMLRAARRASEFSIPLVGVNYGTLGFLTQFERGEEALAADLATSADCGYAEHTMLAVDFRGNTFHCLNELAFLRRIAPDAEDGVVRIDVSIDGTTAGEFTADGLILCTPTGSTAYSLSAGGCILTSDCAAFLLTPVNAFSLRSRPIACSDRSVLGFAFPEGELIMRGDGIFLGEVRRGDSVTVRKSERRAIFLAKEKHDFFRRLTEKIN